MAAYASSATAANIISIEFVSASIQGKHQYPKCPRNSRANDIFRPENFILNKKRVSMVESSLPMFKLPFHREFLGQAWTKEDKKEKAPNICLITARFNDVCLLF